MKKILIILFLLLPLKAQALEQPLDPESFAYGSKLELQGENAFYTFDLPLEVYRAATRPDLGDLRIFNGRDRIVPHSLSRPEAQVTERRNELRAAIPFFPLVAATNENPENLTLHVEKNAQGTIIDLQSGDNPSVDTEKRIAGYILDTTSLTGTPAGPFARTSIQNLELDWDQPRENFMGKITVATSSNLVEWTYLTTATVARLEHQGFRLDLHNIPISGHPGRYLRLTWPDEQEGLNLTRLEGHATRASSHSRKNLSWMTATDQPVECGDGGFVYDLGGFLPVEKIRLHLSGKNSMAVATISSANTSNGPYNRVWQGLLYSLSAGVNYIQSPDITVHSSHQRYWKVTFAKNEAGPPQPPELSVGWQPDRLVFLAQGDGPFRLMYGNAEVLPADFDTEGMFRRFRSAPGNVLAPVTVRVGPQFVQGGASRLNPQPPSPPWRKYLLWLVLVLGVGLIGWQSHSLFRQLQVLDSSDRDS